MLVILYVKCKCSFLWIILYTVQDIIDTQYIVVFLQVLQQVLNAKVRVFFNPVDKHSELPNKSYFRQHIDIKMCQSFHGKQGNPQKKFLRQFSDHQGLPSSIVVNVTFFQFLELHKKFFFHSGRTTNGGPFVAASLNPLEAQRWPTKKYSQNCFN